MKVCHLTSAHDSYDTRIFQKECISLAERGGLEVFLVAPGKSRREKGVTVIGVGDKPENRLKRMTTFTHEVYKAAVSVNAELYHFHDPELLPIGMKLKKDGKIVCACFMIRYPMMKCFHYYYAPRGILIDYENKELLSVFTKKLKKYIRKKRGV